MIPGRTVAELVLLLLVFWSGWRTGTLACPCRENRQESVQEPAQKSLSSTIDAGRSAPKVDALYVGNMKTLKFHRASCRYASCANCRAKFDTREEAVSAGYVPGGCCDP